MYSFDRRRVFELILVASAAERRIVIGPSFGVQDARREFALELAISDTVSLIQQLLSGILSRRKLRIWE
jgi:hypothetical protein